MTALRINDNGIDRDMTVEEEAEYRKAALSAARDEEARLAVIEARLNAKASAQTKLKALGLNDAEIAALVG